MRAERSGGASPRLEGHAALWVVQVVFGLFPLFGKWAFEAFRPDVVAAWRIAFGALVLAPAAALACGRRALPSWADLARLQVLAVLGITLNQVLFLQGLARSTATDAGLIMCLIPVFTFAIAAGVRQERFSPRRGAGVVAAFAGCVWLLSGGGARLEHEHLVGNLLMVLNTLAYALYLVGSRPLARRYPPLAVIAWVYVLSLWHIPFFLGSGELLPAASPRALGSLAYVLLGPTVLAYLLNVFALSRVTASTAAVYIYVQPLISGAAGVALLGESLSARVVTGALAIFTGIALVSLPPKSP